jgi:hypothetical protein
MVASRHDLHCSKRGLLMSHENVELAVRAYDAFNRRDWDVFVAQMDEDVEIVTHIAGRPAGTSGAA